MVILAMISLFFVFITLTWIFLRFFVLRGIVDEEILRTITTYVIIITLIGVSTVNFIVGGLYNILSGLFGVIVLIIISYLEIKRIREGKNKS